MNTYRTRLTVRPRILMSDQFFQALSCLSGGQPRTHDDSFGFDFMSINRAHVPAPIIKQIDGEYTYEKYKNQLLWRIASIDDSNTTGALEFSVQGHPNDFFPVNVSFSSTRSYCDLRVETVIASDNSAPVKFSTDTVFSVDKYEIV